MKFFIICSFCLFFAACSNSTSGGSSGKGGMIPQKNGEQNNQEQEQGQEQGQQQIVCDENGNNCQEGNNGTGTAYKQSSCSLSQVCVDYTGSRFINEGPVLLRNRCTQGNGVFDEAPCSNINRIGTCKLNAGSADEYLVRAYSPIQKLDFQNDCQKNQGLYY